MHFPGALNKIIKSFFGTWQHKGCQICLTFFLFSSAAVYNSVARWMLFFTINLLTSNLERRLGLFFDLDNLLGGGSDVVEVSEDSPFQQSL